MPKTILITGATGNISSGIIAQLKGSEHSLRALVRNPEKAEELRGCEKIDFFRFCQL